MDASGKKPRDATFELQRVFTAPLERVWKAWSEKDQLAEWWGPKGCVLEVLSLDFRPGGFFHYAMKAGGAPTMWGRFNYREIEPQQRMVWLSSFANERCGIERAPFSELCPLEIRNHVVFVERDGATTTTLRAEAFGANDAEVEFFAGLCSSGSLEKGFAGTMDQLAEYLSR